MLFCLPLLVLLAHHGMNSAASSRLGAQTAAVAESTTVGMRVIRGIKVADAPRIDGRLDDPVWASAPVATDFTQNYPHGGVPATRRTEARVLFVGDAVYVGMRAFDSPDSIIAPLMRRDATANYDMLEVLFDSFHDRRTAFHFGVNPAGVKFDIYHYDDSQADISWDAVWDVAVSRDSLGWCAEFRIPLSQLRYSVTGEPATWGVNFYRIIGRSQEWSSWAPVPQGEGREVSRFGELTDIDSLTSVRRREIIPYVSGSMSRVPGERANPFFKSNAFEGGAGVDAKFGVGNGLTLDLTVHPDFGQVEADPSEVNISGFETTFTERRPFFVENGKLFELSIYESPDEVLFYPRRIGRAPQVVPDTTAPFVQEPAQTTIISAAKLSGKTSKGLSVGLLEAVTGAEFADVIDTLGRQLRQPVEPATSYTVARVQKDLRAGKSAIGAMATATNRFNLGATALELHKSAYSGGLDFRHQFGGESGSTYELFGALFASAVDGSAHSIAETQRSSAHYFQRPDADHLTYDTTRTSMSGYAGRLQFDRMTGRVRFGNAFYTRTPGFEVNDIGIQKVADWSENFTWIGTRHLTPGTVFNYWNLYANTWSWWTYGGERTFTQFNVDLEGELRNFWGSFVRLGRRLPAATLRLRGGPLFAEEGGWVVFGNFYSPQQKSLRLNASYSLTRSDAPGTQAFSFAPTVLWQPLTNATLTLGPTFSRERSDIFYVAQSGTDASARYVLGALDRTTAAVTTRLDLAFSPELTLQFYGQPFLSAGTYSDFKEVTSPRAPKYADRFRRFDPQLKDGVYTADTDGNGVPDLQFADPAFNVREFRSNAVLRWEYRSGSTLYVVWSQGRHSDAEPTPFELTHDATVLFRTVPENQFMVKVSRWMSF